MSNKNSPLIEFDSVVKRFPGVAANDGVSFKVEKGTIHSLLGENGASKTTPDEYSLRSLLAGRKFDILKMENGQVMTSSRQFNGLINNIEVPWPDEPKE